MTDMEALARHIGYEHARLKAESKAEIAALRAELQVLRAEVRTLRQRPAAQRQAHGTTPLQRRRS